MSRIQQNLTNKIFHKKSRSPLNQLLLSLVPFRLSYDRAFFQYIQTKQQNINQFFYGAIALLPSKHFVQSAFYISDLPTYKPQMWGQWPQKHAEQEMNYYKNPRFETACPIKTTAYTDYHELSTRQR